MIKMNKTSTFLTTEMETFIKTLQSTNKQTCNVNNSVHKECGSWGKKKTRTH